MSKFAKFMKSNKKEKVNVKYAPTKSLCDENGKPLEWEFRHISTKENEDLKDRCTIETPITGKPGMTKPKLLTGKYIAQMVAASVVEPNLYDKELQDSYGVMAPEDLLMAMVDDPGEYGELTLFIQKLQGFDTTFEDKVDEAKN